MNNKCSKTSLTQLTREFFYLMQKSYYGIINLNQASTVLKVPKRRIYDISNVLEGAGLTQKISKNNIQWKIRQIQLEINNKKQEIENLIGYERLFDEKIVNAEKDLPQNSLNYAEDQDFSKRIINYDHTLLVIKAPSKTIIKLEDFEQKLEIKSFEGKIEVFVCPQDFRNFKITKIN